jgi:hypothetical protein
MNKIKNLQEILNIAYLFDRRSINELPLYKAKFLFDDLVVNDFIDFDSDYGKQIRIVLDSKRKDDAMIAGIRAIACLENTIKTLELEKTELDKVEKQQDDLSIDSTCITVSRDVKEIQLQLNDIPKKIGRPKTNNALTGAQRSKKSRDKKKAKNLVFINTALSQLESAHYNELLAKGFDLNDIISLAYIAENSKVPGEV